MWQSSLLFQNDYTYDTAGQRLTNKITSSDSTFRTELYGYDELNWLKTVDYGDGQTQSYSFDAMGNRASKTDVGGGLNGTENYTVNNANMLLTRGAANYTNDANGNTLTDPTHTNTWDSENRLAKCVTTGANAATSSFVYGSDGIRHSSTVTTGGTTTTTNFVLDNSMFVREQQAGVNYATYLVGVRGPEYRRQDSGTNIGQVRWYVYDGLGSVLAEVDPNGNITSKRKYDIYGLVRNAGVVGDNPGGTSSHKFVGALGHPSEDSTGYIYMQARYMDPSTGRFVSEDVSKDGQDWFTYSNNDPTNKVDRNGHNVVDSTDLGLWFIGLGLAVGAYDALSKGNLMLALNLAAWSIFASSEALVGGTLGKGAQRFSGLISMLITGPGGTWFRGWLDAVVISVQASRALPCNVAVMAGFAYSLTVIAALIMTNDPGIAPGW